MSATISAKGGNATPGGFGGHGGMTNGADGYGGASGGGGGGGRVKLFHGNPAAVHLVEPSLVDVSGGSGASSGGTGTYSKSATESLDGRKIYQEGGNYKKRLRVKLLEE